MTRHPAPPADRRRSAPVAPVARRGAGPRRATGRGPGEPQLSPDRFPTLPAAETRLIRTIRAALLALRGFMESAHRGSGLSDTSYHVLYVLCSSPSGVASPSQLSHHVGMSRPNVTKVIDQLVADGWVTREVETRDARRAVVRATPQGRRVAHAATLKAIDSIGSAFAGLSREELEVLHLLLKKLVATLDAPSHGSHRLPG